jgi:hypothetical protein
LKKNASQAEVEAGQLNSKGSEQPISESSIEAESNEGQALLHSCFEDASPRDSSRGDSGSTSTASVASVDQGRLKLKRSDMFMNLSLSL